MSIVAEFAARIHSQAGPTLPREHAALDYPSSVTRLHDVRAVVFDVYGTLIDYWRPEFGDTDAKAQAMGAAFQKVVDFFGLEAALVHMNPADPAAKTLSDFYHGLIALDHEKSRSREVEYPEILIERVWGIILQMLRRHGLSSNPALVGDDSEAARCMAFYYNFHALGRGFFPGVVSSLQELRERNITLGILSNGQFYTPMDLTLFARDQSNESVDSYTELFDEDLVFFSFQYRMAKPSPMLYRKLFDALYELQILPAQTVFVGNDLASDIGPAKEIGLRTALFTGNRDSTFLHGGDNTVVPDLSFSDYADLPDMLLFHGEGNSQP